MRSQTIPDHALPYIDLPRVHYFLIFMDAVSPTDLRETISYPEFRCRLETLQRDYPNIQGVVCDGFVPNDQQFPELATARCPAGTTKLSVMPDGSTYPCYLLFRYPEFLLGNIFTDSIDALLTHPMLHFFRTFEGNSCKNKHCVYHADCHGGCPAVSLLLTRDITAPDPRCQVG
jgi:radical SAM protein with 4Fe4S-binding SPASM domain